MQFTQFFIEWQASQALHMSCSTPRTTWRTPRSSIPRAIRTTRRTRTRTINCCTKILHKAAGCIRQVSSTLHMYRHRHAAQLHPLVTLFVITINLQIRYIIYNTLIFCKWEISSVIYNYHALWRLGENSKPWSKTYVSQEKGQYDGQMINETVTQRRKFWERHSKLFVMLWSKKCLK